MKGNPRLKTLDQIARKLGLVVDLVPIEDSLRGSPFERAPLATAQAMMPRGSQVASASKKELIGVGASKDYDWMPGGVF